MADEQIKKYWKSIEERDAVKGDHDAENELAFKAIEGRSNRRDFLKLAGFAFAATAASGCARLPIRKAIPYLMPIEEIVPGKAYHYATTCGACPVACGLLAKNRDGRPIKLEGNPDHPLSRGGACAVGHASILGLYDSLRLKGPTIHGAAASWEVVDKAILLELNAIRKRGGAVRALTGALHGPATLATIQKFLNTFTDARHVMYDALSSSAAAAAHEKTHGVRVLPHYRIDRAEVIVGLDADFLGTWVSPVEFTRGYSAARLAEGKTPKMTHHAQVESRMTLTGAKADRRVLVAPDEIGLVTSLLADRLAELTGRWPARAASRPVHAAREAIDEIATRLWAARGRALVVSGVQDVEQQILVNYMNHLLGAYGKTVDIAVPSLQRPGDDRGLEQLLKELREGAVSALFIAGANPLHGLPGADALREALKRVPLVVSLSERADETAEAAKYVCPDAHYLESWGDAEPVAGVVSVFQPTIRPLADTRSKLESFAAWSGAPASAYDIIRGVWREQIFPLQTREASFDAFWDRVVHDGHGEISRPAPPAKPFDASAVRFTESAPMSAAGEFSLVLYPKVGMLDGRHSHNPWLHEMPDPITKITWDNYACLSPDAAKRLGAAEGDIVRLAMPGEGTLTLPALIQPGQHDSVVAVALGYGGRDTARFAKAGPQWISGNPSVGEDGLVGKNAAPLLSLSGGLLHYTVSGVHVTKTGRSRPLAATQRHHTLTVPKRLALPGIKRRPIVQETTLEAFAKNPSAGAHHEHESEGELWPDDHKYNGMRWGMAIDLTKCTGCSACVVSCQAENNVPVVGRDEVRRSREMHWLRIDRYYSGGGGGTEVVFQPMLCQQCAHAPCETVCPVLATVHSSEGLNQQVYNRCVGTRYCANNCPYKVRRFNWFDYPRNDKLANMALNPDVAVRMRGIMEKCTFCVQRIQEAKIESKSSGRGKPADGEIKTACQQSCPAGAIAFGDLNDPKSEVSKLMKNPRRYRVLEEINVQPSIGYLRIVRNRKESSR